MTPWPRRAEPRTPLLLVAGVLTALLLGVATPPPAAVADRTGAVWPLSPRPRVVHGFDPPPQPWRAGHRGVDLAGRPGQPVHATMPGTVSFAGAIAGRGVVVVDHGTTRTTYQPVTATVSRGTVVTAGRVLGRLTVVGSHCFPATCLHWGLVRGAETYLDPLTLVGGGPVRLLPLAGLPLAGLPSAWGAPGPVRPAVVDPVVDGWARTLTPGGVPAGRPAGAGRS